MSNSNKQVVCCGCCGCLALVVIPLFFLVVGYQSYYYQMTGKLDLSPPKIKLGLPTLGTPKSVQLCADHLKQAPYASSININDKTISFYVEEKAIDFSSLKPYPDNPSGDDINKYWQERPNAMWSIINEQISNDIRSKCQAPVTVSYTYLYVKLIFRGQVVLQDS